MRKNQGIYYPDASEFFADPSPFTGKDVHLGSLWILEIDQTRPVVFKQGGIEDLLYVTDVRHLAASQRIQAGDNVMIVLYCGEGSLSGGNILKSIKRK